jgi:cation-transporting ATPase E
VDTDFNQVVVTLIAQSNLSMFLSIATMLLVLFLHPPHPFFMGWRPLSPDRRPALMTLALVVLFLALLSYQPVIDYFGIIGAPLWVRGILGLFLLIWLLGFRLILRRRWVDKLLLPV